uniref:Uncharacterized protein n=1 Tax=Arundo donax TaxID=35708 RepID=A0A0A9ETQ5_ARUDO
MSPTPFRAELYPVSPVLRGGHFKDKIQRPAKLMSSRMFEGGGGTHWCG